MSETPTVRPTVEISKPHKLAASEAAGDGKKVDTPAGQHIVGFVHPTNDDDDENEAPAENEMHQVEELKQVRSCPMFACIGATVL